MGLSSDTLIQQTSFDNLVNILKKKESKVSYCKEHFEYGEPVKSYTHIFAMICFSEIPISSLHNHLYRYGDCIIGINKNWAIKMELNQVHYYQKDSLLTKSLFETYHSFFNKVVGKKIHNTSQHKEDIKTYNHLEYQIAYSKNYDGVVSSKYYSDNNYIFAEEKEWRFVPVNGHIDRPISLVPSEFEKEKSKYQQKIGVQKLPFELKDINYIVVETECQKVEIREFLLSEHSEIHINIFTNSEINRNFFGYKNPSIKEYNLKKEIERLKIENNKSC